MTFTFNADRLPFPADIAMAARESERWRTAITDHAGLRSFTEAPDGRRLLAAIFGNSPFLSKALIEETTFVEHLLNSGPEAVLAAIFAELDDLSLDGPNHDERSLESAMRRVRRRAALAIGLADVAGLWDLEQVTEALSMLADRAIAAALRHLLRRAHEAGEIVLPDPGEPEKGCGLVVLGMGKLGARELNYSSDVDLILLFDTDILPYHGRRSLPELYVRLTRHLVALLAERTADGHVFRVDLRLRPDPGSTPLALSLTAAEIYYEAYGQNWERAAMIKARIVAGDRAVGVRFLDLMQRFIWRRHLDFAAIRDIQSIKRQINEHHGGKRIAVAGHNLKLGRGGIREIEFFVQTQQLVFGGREPILRESATIAALAALTAAGHLAPAVEAELTAAYRFLRRLEHRLQMVDDRQTHTLPAGAAALLAIARFAGYADQASFSADVLATLQTVERHYARLFEHTPPLARGGNLVFTGEEDDPETLKTLSAMGYTQAAMVSRQIRGWHRGRVRATQTAGARAYLTEVLPTLLEALGRMADPDATFLRFDGFLARLPSGLPLFALLTSNPPLLDLLAEVLGNAPRMAEQLARNPRLLDGLLTADAYAALPARPVMASELSALLRHYADVQEILDAARRWNNERKFRVGVQTLRRLVSPQQIGWHLSDLAEATLGALQPQVEAAFARQHGQVAGNGVAIVALGKLGGREMTANSDLDLILVYDTPGDGVEEDGLSVGRRRSNGVRPLEASDYFARLVQRLISAVMAKTGEGNLYDVDMRLRPSGNSGPIATSLEAFARYQASAAWTWEHMALTRARVITGTPRLRAAIEAVIGETLRRPRDAVTVRADVSDMRRKMAAQHKGADPWDVKHRRGGLIDIEFIAQYLQLRWAHHDPAILATNTNDVLAAAARLGRLTEAQSRLLRDGWQLWTAIQQILRLTVDGVFDEQAASPPLRDLLVEATGARDVAHLKRKMAARAGRVHALYRRLIDDPA